VRLKVDVMSLFNRRTRPVASHLGCRASLYEAYFRNRSLASHHIATLRPEQRGEFVELTRWNKLFRECGIEARSRWLGPSKFAVEIVDMNEEPAWVIYPVADAWQVDEFDGTSQRARTLGEALQLVRRM